MKYFSWVSKKRIKAIARRFLSLITDVKIRWHTSCLIKKHQKINNIDKIIYINLSHRRDRKELMESQLCKINLPYERFDAIKPTQDDINKGGKYYEYWLRGNCNAGALGAYLSQYSVHKRALKEKWNNYLLLEDDVIINESCLRQLDYYIDKKIIPEDWDMVRSVWRSHSVKVKKFKTSFILSRYCSSDSHKNWGGTHFTLVNGKSISKIIDLMEKDNVISPDGVYGSHMINVYHSKFGIDLNSTLGTDVQDVQPKLKTKKFVPMKIRNML